MDIDVFIHFLRISILIRKVLKFIDAHFITLLLADNGTINQKINKYVDIHAK